MILHKILDCISIPILIILLSGMIIIFLNKTRNRYLFLGVVLFSLTWRILRNTQASRYFLIFIPYSILLLAIAQRTSNISTSKRRWAAIAGVLAISIYFIFIDFSSFRNNYVFDLRDSIKYLSKNDPSAVIDIYQKERSRILNEEKYNTYDERIKAIGDYENYNNLTEYYFNKSYAPNTLFCCLKFESQRKENEFINSSSGIKKLGRVHTNKKKEAFIDVLKHPPLTPVPAIDVNHFFPGCIFKAFIYEYNTFIYQCDKKIVWLIGKQIDKEIEVIYHIYSINRFDLPKYRIQFGYDNLGFNIKSTDNLQRIDNYIVVSKEIPQNYRVRNIVCGFRNPRNNTIEWTSYLDID